MTEDQARECWCPFAYREGFHAPQNRNTDNSPKCTCLASKCMAWRWESPSEGYCGLVNPNGVGRITGRIT
jgi:hypothetical protein